MDRAIEALPATPSRAVTSAVPASRLVLGTAQFGMAYGATNERGQVSEAAVAQILSLAQAAGIDTVDTAAAYGDSEAILGACLADFPAVEVITKTPACPGDRISAADADALRASLERSLARLRRSKVDAVLLHQGPDLLKPGGDRLARALEALKGAGLAARIGVSIYDGAELDGILQRLSPDIVQAPLNLFDQRLIENNHIARLKSAGVEIHARSIFLQGVLLADPRRRHGYFKPFDRKFAAYGATLARARLTPLQACLGFVLRQSGADRAVIGVSGMDDFREILATLAAMPSSLPDMGALAADDSALIDPRCWRLG